MTESTFGGWTVSIVSANDPGLIFAGQQGPHSRLRGIDPLWLLNHYTFLDSGRENRRPLTFSRYAGPGSRETPSPYNFTFPNYLSSDMRSTSGSYANPGYRSLSGRILR